MTGYKCLRYIHINAASLSKLYYAQMNLYVQRYAVHRDIILITQHTKMQYQVV